MTVTHKSSKPNFISNIFFQMLPVMLGVFLGLWANNWNEGRQQKKLETKVLQKIKQDIESNRENLANVIEYHESLADSAKAVRIRLDKKLLFKSAYELEGDGPSFWRGTRTGNLRDAGYQTAIVSGVLAEMDFELVSLFSEIDRVQSSYSLMANNYLQTIINQNSDTKVMDYLVFVMSFSQDVSIAEKNLIELYDLALSKM
ncbi:MAG: hypothetical protein AB8F94_16785 [Saprospiraceae bacterium]